MQTGLHQVSRAYITWQNFSDFPYSADKNLKVSFSRWWRILTATSAIDLFLYDKMCRPHCHFRLSFWCVVCLWHMSVMINLCSLHSLRNSEKLKLPEQTLFCSKKLKWRTSSFLNESDQHFVMVLAGVRLLYNNVRFWLHAKLTNENIRKQLISRFYGKSESPCY